MKKACGSFLPTQKIHHQKKLTLLRINLKKQYFQIIITKLICSFGYNKYAAKLSDLVTPALDYSPATLAGVYILSFPPPPRGGGILSSCWVVGEENQVGK